MRKSHDEPVANRPPDRIGPFVDDDEYPHSVVAERGWSESYLVQAYSPSTGVGVFAHSNRSYFDPDLWSEVFAIYLPNDQFVTAKGFGYASHESEIGGSLAIRVDEPFVRGKMLYRGAGQIASGESLRSGALPSGQHVSVDVALTQTALGPAFPVGDVSSGAFGHTHYEQHMMVSGYVSYAGRRTEFDGSGIRDHTWGPRDLSVMGSHVWLHGEFPSGRWFTVLYVCQGAGGPPLMEFYTVGDRYGTEPVVLTTPPPLLADENQVSASYALDLRGERRRHRITAEIVSPMTFSFCGPNEMTLGAQRLGDCSHTVFECQTRYKWDGETGYGLTERSVVR